ncbi:hypothetical protein, partial [Ruthenibacterium lactatiformans]|uniref:hypothetical protein n=1 Tax=Ruthenibacterium lactatiformans TaxID=1550024 RepID=UPI003AF0E652
AVCPFSGNGAEMQRNTGYFPTESLEPSSNRLFSRSALNEGYLFRGSLDKECRIFERILCHARQIFAGIAALFQGNLTQQGAKSAG